MGYYKSSDLPYYYSLFPQFTPCANYSCGVLSETYPNRLVLYPGTSGGDTGNDINNRTLRYPCVLDLLSGHGVSFKNYNFHCPSNYSILALVKKWATGRPDDKLNQSKAQFGAWLRPGPARSGRASRPRPARSSGTHRRWPGRYG